MFRRDGIKYVLADGEVSTFTDHEHTYIILFSTLN